MTFDEVCPAGITPVWRSPPFVLGPGEAAWDDARSVWDNGGSRWSNPPLADLEAPALEVAVRGVLYRLDAGSGAVITDLLIDPGAPPPSAGPFAFQYGPHSYAQAGDAILRFHLDSGQLDDAWAYVRGGMVALAADVSAGRLFVSDGARVRAVDLAGPTEAFVSGALYDEVCYLAAGPGGEAYAATRSRTKVDDRMRVYRLAPDGGIVWATVLPLGWGPADEWAGMAYAP